MTRDILRFPNIDEQIVCTPFSPPVGMPDLSTFGVVEPFDDTVATVRVAASYLRPSGMLITSIPNIVGGVGALRMIMNRPVYDIHQSIDPTMLKSAQAIGRAKGGSVS